VYQQGLEDFTALIAIGSSGFLPYGNGLSLGARSRVQVDVGQESVE